MSRRPSVESLSSMVSYSVCPAVGGTPPGGTGIPIALILGEFICFPLSMVGGLGDIGLEVFRLSLEIIGCLNEVGVIVLLGKYVVCICLHL